MPGRRPAAPFLLRLASVGAGLLLMLWVSTADRTAPVRFALVLFALAGAFLSLQAVSYLIETGENFWRPRGGARWRPAPGDVVLWIGVMLLLTTGLPRLVHLATRIPYQTVVSCRTGRDPRWFADVALSRGERVSLTFVLGPGDGCVPAGTSFEKRRWEDAYLIGGEPTWEKAWHRSGMMAASLLGLGSLALGLWLRARRRAPERPGA